MNATETAVKNLSFENGIFSEIFIKKAGHPFTKGAFFPDPLTYLIATSKPEDNFLIEKIHSEKKSYFESFSEILKEKLEDI